MWPCRWSRRREKQTPRESSASNAAACPGSGMGETSSAGDPVKAIGEEAPVTSPKKRSSIAKSFPPAEGWAFIMGFCARHEWHRIKAVYVLRTPVEPADWRSKSCLIPCHSCLSLCHCGARRGCCRTPDTTPCSRRSHAT